MDKFTKFQEFLEPLETSLEYSSDFSTDWLVCEETENKLNFFRHIPWKVVITTIDKEMKNVE